MRRKEVWLALAAAGLVGLLLSRGVSKCRADLWPPELAGVWIGGVLPGGVQGILEFGASGGNSLKLVVREHAAAAAHSPGWLLLRDPSHGGSQSWVGTYQVARAQEGFSLSLRFPDYATLETLARLKHVQRSHDWDDHDSYYLEVVNNQPGSPAPLALESTRLLRFEQRVTGPENSMCNCPRRGQ